MGLPHIARHGIGYRSPPETRAVRNVLDDVAGTICEAPEIARHGVGHRSTEETRVRDALDDMAGVICSTPLCGAADVGARAGVRGVQGPVRAARQGLTLVHLSAQHEPFLILKTPPKPLDTLSIPAMNTLQTPHKHPLSHRNRLR